MGRASPFKFLNFWQFFNFSIEIMLVNCLFRPLVNRSMPQRYFHRMPSLNTSVAVVLSGCGVYDGTELHEASACLVHLSRGGADVSMFAPDIPQMHVIDHSKGQPAEGQSRNVLVESARIARGNVKDLSELKASGFDAVVFPGGFGAAKNLCNFATNGADCTVEPNVSRVLKEFHDAKKPIGLCCIAPVLAAKGLPGCTVTIGTDDGTASAIEKMGSKHHKTDVTESNVDAANKIVTTGAYMFGDAPLHKIFDGIGSMIENVLKL